MPHDLGRTANHEQTASPSAASVDSQHFSTDTEPAPPVPTAPIASSARYELGEEIARGGMGVVYRAVDTTLSRQVAVKVLQERFAPDSGTARRFAEEARITAQLQHPNIPPVHDLGTMSDGRSFLAMKLIKGQTLDRELQTRTDLSAERGHFIAVFEQICQAVAYAHAHDVIHRDLKPGNVMVGNYGEVQVMDWGLAKVLADRPAAAQADTVEAAVDTRVVSLRDTDDHFTQAGSVLGTPAFMPPEQAVGAVHQIDARSDVFGLGAILAVILTGQPPFLGDSAEETRLRAARGKVADCFARLDACGADPDLIALCKRCLSPEPEDRPADAGVVARAVADLRAAADERARQADLNRVKAEGEKAAADLRAAEQRRRRSLLLVAAGVVVVIFAAATAVSIWQAGLARIAEVKAKKDAEDARQAKVTADEAREAEKREREATDEVMGFLSSVLAFASSRGQGPNPVRNPTVKQALDSAGEKISDRFADRPLVEAKVRKAIGFAYHGLNDVRGSMPHLRRRLEIHRAHLGDDHQTTWEDMNNLGQVLMVLGREHYAEAEQLLVTVLAKKRAKLGDEHISTIKGIMNLGGLYRRQVRTELGRFVPTPDFGSLVRLAWIMKRLELAEALHMEAYQTCRRALPPEHDQRFKIANNVGALRIDQNRLAEAVPYFREGAEGMQQAAGNRFPSAQCWKNVGDALWAVKKNELAEVEYRKALAILDRIPASEANLRVQIFKKMPKLARVSKLIGTWEQSGDPPSAGKMPVQFTWDGKVVTGSKTGTYKLDGDKLTITLDGKATASTVLKLTDDVSEFKDADDQTRTFTRAKKE